MGYIFLRSTPWGFLGLHISNLYARPTVLSQPSRCLTFFYFVSYTSGFYSFNSPTSGVSPCSSNPPKSMHDWKQKFFYIHRGAIPVDVHYRAESEGVPMKNVSIYFVEQEWYKSLTRKATSISQLEERALVGAVGFSLLNVLDPKAAGAMVEAILPEGKHVWLEQIRDRFLHPTSDSFAAYANTILRKDDGDEFDDTTDPTREEVIVLSSEGSDRSREGLIPRSPRAGPAQGTANEPVNEPVDVDVDPPVETAEQLETWKKKKLDKSEKKGKKVEENVAEAPRKQPSNHLFLDYVVVSDTLSSLGAGEKRIERDPDDDKTLTEIMKKRKTLD
ncbi:hypothetical protein Hdeb2414_s0006g00206671 [Helianthus debilis subsp. tardiflorus]